MKNNFFYTSVTCITIAIGAIACSLELNAKDVSTYSEQSCQWLRIKCPNGTSFEACLTSGDGKACECGTTTRDCNGGAGR